MKIPQHIHPVNERHHGDGRTRGERYADNVATAMGSWKFVIWQTIVVLIWIALNLVAVSLRWDPYPFILLNLMFSTQAAYASPIILLAGNRQASKDRDTLEHTEVSAREADTRLEEMMEQNLRMEEQNREILKKLDDRS